MKTRILSQQGYTVIELLIAAAMAGMMSLAMSTAVVQFVQHSRSLATKAQRDSDAKGLSNRFARLVENAAIATRFEHLPIRNASSCGADQPCLRRLAADKTFQNLGGPITGVSTSVLQMSFFSDTDVTGTSLTLGGVTETNRIATQAMISGGGNPTVIQRGTALDVSQAGDVYATWPLIPNQTAATTDDSPPFTVLVAQSQDYFTFNNTFAGDQTSTNNWVFFIGSRDNINPTELEGTFLLLYNAFNPHQYGVMVTQTAINCTTNGSQCLTQANALGSALGMTGTFADATQFAGQYALELVNASSTTGNPAKRFFDNYVTYGTSALGFDSSGWFNQTPKEYLFPSTVFSMLEPGNPDVIYSSMTLTGAEPFDPRRVARFYAQQPTLRSQLVGVPIDALALYLKYDAVQNRNVLLHSKFNTRFNTPPSGVTVGKLGDPEYPLVDEVEGTIYIARRLGSPTLHLFVYRDTP